MEKKVEELIKEHLLTDDKEFKNAYEQNPPLVATEIQWQPGEQIISELPQKDLIQLLSRYLNNDGVYVKNLLHLLLRIEKELTWLLEANGVDVNKKFKEDAKRQAELIEENIEKAKQEIKKSVAKN